MVQTSNKARICFYHRALRAGEDLLLAEYKKKMFTLESLKETHGERGKGVSASTMSVKPCL